MLGAFLKSKAFQELVRTTVAEYLRSGEGQELLAEPAPGAGPPLRRDGFPSVAHLLKKGRFVRCSSRAIAVCVDKAQRNKQVLSVEIPYGFLRRIWQNKISCGGPPLHGPFCPKW